MKKIFSVIADTIEKAVFNDRVIVISGFVVFGIISGSVLQSLRESPFWLAWLFWIAFFIYGIYCLDRSYKYETAKNRVLDLEERNKMLTDIVETQAKNIKILQKNGNTYEKTKNIF